MYAHQRRSAFSLIELVIVIVIIGIIGAIAIPRMSRGASGASDNALKANLSVLRSAIDLFHTEHGAYPKVADLPNALIQYSDEAGTAFNANKTITCYFGPYLRSVPPLPVGPKKGGTLIAAADGANVGWIYDENAGTIKANCTTEKDDKGNLYTSY